MASADRKVRIFVSSTFRDMHAERDHLVTVVFPELRERLETLGLLEDGRIRPLDLTEAERRVERRRTPDRRVRKDRRTGGDRRAVTERRSARSGASAET